jgi:uncharacterized protein YlzI (FlbEa/FlbD family)
MIRLTLKSTKKPIYIAPEAITAICDNRDGGAEVYSGVDFSLVTESPEEVVRKVLEWRLEMEAYKQSVLGNNFNISADCASRLRLLAGLEEGK